MEQYPEAVQKIVEDYLERVTAQLRGVPAAERHEFLGELRSHIFEAYQQSPAESDVDRVLAVLRNLGEPADVVADRLPAAMVRSGSDHKVPLHLIGGLLLALFGLPLGFGGASVIVGLLLALSGATAAFFAATGAVLFAGSIILLLGLSRYSMPAFFDRLVENGVIHLNGPFEILTDLPARDQGLILMIVAGVFIAAGLGMFWLGKRMIRGLRFLYSLVGVGARRLAHTIRRKAREARANGLLWGGSYNGSAQQSTQ